MFCENIDIFNNFQCEIGLSIRRKEMYQSYNSFGVSSRKRIPLSFSLMSMVARRLKLRFRALPENRAAIKATLMISDTAKLMMLRFLLKTYTH